MPPFTSDEELLEYVADDCDGLYTDAVCRGVVQPVIVVFDLLDPAGRDAAVSLGLVAAEVADAVCQLSASDGEPSAIFLDLSLSEAIDAFGGILAEHPAPLDAPLPSDHYRLVVFAAGAVGVHQRTIPPLSAA